MATQTPPSAADKKKPMVSGRQQHYPSQPFKKKPAFAAPMQGLEHIIFDNTGTAKAASNFNLNIKAISEHLANHLKFYGPLAVLAVCKLKQPVIVFPPDPLDNNQVAM
jgi:hypothetical protein